MGGTCCMREIHWMLTDLWHELRNIPGVVVKAHGLLATETCGCGCTCGAARDAHDERGDHIDTEIYGGWPAHDAVKVTINTTTVPKSWQKSECLFSPTCCQQYSSSCRISTLRFLEFLCCQGSFSRPLIVCN